MAAPAGRVGEALMWSAMLRRARLSAGLSQAVVAVRAGTSRPTLSAYEQGRKAPVVDTLERLLTASGHRLDVVPVVSWRQVDVGRGRTAPVPDVLWRLPVETVFADVVLPLQVSWSSPGRAYQVRDRRQRARLYEVVLREGGTEELMRYLDGPLLVDLWDELVLPRAIRQAWQPVIEATLHPVPGAVRARGYGAAS
jgi:transcriptional regulator with XRE-family HTH domain